MEHEYKVMHKVGDRMLVVAIVVMEHPALEAREVAQASMARDMHRTPWDPHIAIVLFNEC